jgi:acyl-CoA synthetase (AMP-forming)/AMP-acid ligase II
MFDTQVAEIQSTYGIGPGGVDLSCFPLFALFNAAMGVTTVLPDMDFSRPASADPKKLLAAANDWKVTQAFASPAVWRNLDEHCGKTGDRIDSLRLVFSCGAPVSAKVLRSTLAIAAPNAKMHTPYGATECLPVATIEAAEVLGVTAARTSEGAGVCVGQKFDSIEWRVIRITDEPIAAIDDAEELPTGEIGELIVRGPQASPRYVTRTECNAESKIADSRAGASSPPVFWHRMGDVGYLDDAGRFWYCGRKSQRVETAAGTMFTESYEAVFDTHPAVRRSALVGIGPRGNQKPVMILEVNWPLSSERQGELRQILQDDNPTTLNGEIMVVDWPLPVDVRHNAKINREQLAAWAATQLPELA